MKAIEIGLLWLDQALAYLAACWSLPWSAPGCLPLWYWVSVTSMGAGVLLLLWVAWRVIDYYRMLRAALRAQAAREAVADEETINRHRWVGEDDAGPVDPDLAAKIRAEIERKKLREAGLLPKT